MGDEFKQVRPNEIVQAGHPIVSTKRANLLSQVAKERLGGQLPVPGAKPLGGKKKWGRIKTWNAATWDNATQITAGGSVVIYTDDAEGKLDAARTISLDHDWDVAAEPGERISWKGSEIENVLCGAPSTWDPTTWGD